MKTHAGLLEQCLDEEKVQIVAEYRAVCAQARRHAEQRLELHRLKRRHLFSIIGALAAPAAQERTKPLGG